MEYGTLGGDPRANTAMQAQLSKRPPSHLERADGAIETAIRRVVELTEVIGQAADRLYGARPEGAENNPREIHNEGLTGRILNNLDTLSERLSEAEEQARRLSA